ncbi:hypothetical protein [Roseovarius aestuariivivens]|uniref:hypothetical protein n=1 Tax=Roseovarius aestuariivivens TaxID=1888910 RepID=UPI0010811B73|nr:hypothetical protein [Roseovarius aestuariivivens]
MTTQDPETMLVFLANGTLEGEERAAVEAAVAADPALAQELEALKALRRSMQQEGQVQTPGDIGLARLMRDIESESGTASNGIVAANSATAPRLWKVAAVVLLGLFVAQTVYVGQTRQPGMELATGAPETVGEAYTLRVAFADDATEAELRALLLAQGLDIIAGPSALGLYTLAAQDAPSLEAARSALSTRPDLIDSVE